MFEISSEKIDLNQPNILKKKEITLDKDLDCFILISGNNESFVEVAINNILDALIDKITTTNTYKEFSIALENINAFIKTWKLDGNHEIKTDIIIGILNKNSFIFSQIGESSCYLIKNDNELLELTNKQDNKEEFNFISSGDIKNDEIIVLSNKRILEYLSPGDIVDGVNEKRDVNIFNNNIRNILLEELSNDNICFTAIKYISETIIKEQKHSIFDNIECIYHKAKNTKILTHLKTNIHSINKKVETSSKKMKNLVFVGGLSISLILIYQVLSALIGVTTNNSTKDLAKEEFLRAQNHIRIASENISNKNNFNLQIQSAEQLIEQIKQKKVFLNDIEKISNDIKILKKQFDKIETFEESQNNIVYQGDIKDAVKIFRNNDKTFIIDKKGLIGPIIATKKPKKYTFNGLEDTEVFVDAAGIGSDIFLLTSFSKIVRFSKNGYFNYTDVIGQKTWEKSKQIQSYGQNIYLVGKENSQIFRHSKNGNKFNSAKGYLKKDDLSQIGPLKSIGIDGGFYLLKKDLSILKFYASPKYRIEKLNLNKFPSNYTQITKNIELKTRPELNYLYMLLNNKIWILKPNSKDYRNTQSLTYIGQIEGNTSKIKDFFVNYDGQIHILNDQGVYKIDFEISNDQLILK